MNSEVAYTKSYSPNTSSHPDFVFLPLPLDELTPSKHNDSVDFITVITSLYSSCRASLQELLIEMIQKQVQHKRLACIIFDSVMYSTKEVARHLKLPSIMFDTSCATFMHVCPEIRKPGYSSFQDSKSIELVPGLHPLRFKDLPIYNAKYKDAFLQVAAGTHNIDTSLAIVFNSLDCLEQPSLLSIYKIPIFPIGPLHTLSPAAL